MKKLSELIVEKRYVFIVIMLTAAVICALLIPKLEVNRDMTKYLPDDSNMKAGMDIMSDEFPDTESYQTIRVMFDDLTDVQRTEMLEKLEALPNVSSVTYDAQSPDYNKENHTLYILNTEYDYDSPEELAIESALDTDFANADMIWQNDNDATSALSPFLIALALTVLMIILFVMCGSWIEPFLFLAVIGVAVLINMGTNLIMGSVSYITFSIASILQLILSMDYSIILINRYRQEKEHTENSADAMKAALTHAFSSVASSAMTTVVGLLMLLFMSFKIGMDLGIVLAKGVFISMLCVVTMMPGVILLFDKLIVKTAKKELHIPMKWAAKFSYRSRIVMGVAFVLFFGAVCFLQNKTEIAYTLQKEDQIAEVFPQDNTLVVLYDSKDEEKLQAVADELEHDSHIKSVMSYYTQLSKPYTSAQMTEKISEMSTDMALDKSMIDMLYYSHYGADTEIKLTAGEFLEFLSNDVLQNEAFSGYIDDSMKDSFATLQGFSDAEELTSPKTAAEIADFFGMGEEQVSQLFMYYSMVQNGGASEEKITLSDITDFIITELAADENYSAYFSTESIGQMEQMSAALSEEMMNAPYTSAELAAVLGMNEQQAEQIFQLYASLHTEEPEMSVSEFIAFVDEAVLSNPELSAQFDESMVYQLKAARAVIDAVVSEKAFTAEEMYDLFGSLSNKLNADTLSMLYLYYGGTKNSDTSWTLSVEELFHDITSSVESGSPLASFLDDEMNEKLNDARASLADGKAQLVADGHSRMIVRSDYAEESPETTAFYNKLTARLDDTLDGSYYLIGNSAMNYEMKQSFHSELLFITLLTAAAIFLIVAVTFRSVVIPFILVALVQGGVFATVSLIGLRGDSIFYLALLIVECILMGATIDYGILFTNYYREARDTMQIQDSLSAAYEGATHTILTSGLILILVTAILGRLFADPTVRAIVGTISIGSLCAVLLILFVLPGLLAICDKLVIKKK